MILQLKSFMLHTRTGFDMHPSVTEKDLTMKRRAGSVHQGRGLRHRLRRQHLKTMLRAGPNSRSPRCFHRATAASLQRECVRPKRGYAGVRTPISVEIVRAAE
jgi:hypothetical protein